MTEISEVAERVAARRAELDEEEKLLVERLEKVRAERDRDSPSWDDQRGSAASWPGGEQSHV